MSVFHGHLAKVTSGVVALLLLSTSACSSEPDPNNVVPDAGFRTCLNLYLGAAPASPISAADLEGLEGEINCVDMGINSIAGAENLIKITKLNLKDNGITDISPLAELTKLWDLELAQNGVSDFTALRGWNIQIGAKYQNIKATAKVVVEVPLPIVIDPREVSHQPGSTGETFGWHPAPEGAEVNYEKGTVVYPAAGEYVWGINNAGYVVTDGGGFFIFNESTITVTVS
jgi:Leucine-rich repeat (LRR) protein